MLLRRLPSSGGRDITTTDQLLFQRIANGDDEALRRLMHKYDSELIGYLRKHVPHSDLDDVLQLVWTGVWKYFQKPTAVVPDNPRAWLYTCCKRQSLNWSRSDREYWQFDETWDKPSPDAYEQLVQKAASQRMLQEMGQLPARQKQALTMSVIEGHSHSHIAEHMEVEVGAVKNLLSRARGQLRTKGQSLWAIPVIAWAIRKCTQAPAAASAAAMSTQEAVLASGSGGFVAVKGIAIALAAVTAVGGGIEANHLVSKHTTGHHTQQVATKATSASPADNSSTSWPQQTSVKGTNNPSPTPATYIIRKKHAIAVGDFSPTMKQSTVAVAAPVVNKHVGVAQPAVAAPIKTLRPAQAKAVTHWAKNHPGKATAVAQWATNHPGKAQAAGHWAKNHPGKAREIMHRAKNHPDAVTQWVKNHHTQASVNKWVQKTQHRNNSSAQEGSVPTQSHESSVNRQTSNQPAAQTVPEKAVSSVNESLPHVEQPASDDSQTTDHDSSQENQAPDHQ